MPSLRAARGLFVLFFLQSVGASAAEYKVSYAIDAGDINDGGVVACDDKSDCEFRSKKLQLLFTLEFRDPVSRRVTIRIAGQGDRWGCCYFSDGSETVERDPTDSPLHLNLYAGKRRARNEFRINEPLGILYLQFLDAK